MRFLKTMTRIILVLLLFLGGLGLWAFTTQKSIVRMRRSISATSDLDYATGYFSQTGENQLFDFNVDIPADVIFSSWERNLWGNTEIILKDGDGKSIAWWNIQNGVDHVEWLQPGDYTLVAESNLNLMGGYVVALACLSHRQPLVDTDSDGLPDLMEREQRTDAAHPDTDADGLTDYEEIRKYGTDPLNADSDGDGISDYEWHERREFTYTIQAIVNLRPPFALDEMQDFFQDVRLVAELDDDVAQLEVILYPEAREIINPVPFAVQNSAYTAPTFTKNYGSAMQSELGDLIQGVATDLEASLRVMRYLTQQTETIRPYEDLGYSSSLPLNFEMYLSPDGELIKTGSGKPSHTPMEEIEATVLFADSMFAQKTRGACSSTSTLRGAMLRSVGLAEKTIVTIPLLYFYEDDDTIVRLKAEYWDESYAAMTGSGASVADHFFNQVKIGNRWIRVDHAVYNGTKIGGKNTPYLKILEQHEILEDDFTEYWNYNTWRDKRPYQYISIIEQEPIHSRQR